MGDFNEKNGSEPIAIVGMACRLSGIATSPEGLWRMLSNGLTGWSSSTSNRFKLDSFWHPQHDLSGSFSTRGFHLIKQDPAMFDNEFFGISNVEARAIDPQHRMMLEVAFAAFEDSGIPMEKLIGSDTAVFCAVSHHDYEKILGRDAEVSPGYRFTGTGPSILANRISYVFDLHGPSITLDTACSSGLVALHQACAAIRNGEASQALVGGSNLILDPDQAAVMSSMSFLSPHGRCYSFDSRADGFGRGEGIAAMILKPLSQALRDGDNIRAVIRGTEIGQDGRTAGITMPSSDAQIRMISSAYKRAGLDPRDTPYVEAHGTGTTAGDRIEAMALKETFCKDRNNTKLLVGSVKANVGHTESVAGLVGVIKTVLMLEKGLIPPNPTFVKPSDSIPLDAWKLKVPTELMAWPENTVRRASINSFGYGGTNGHAIIEAANQYSGYSSRQPASHLQLFVFSHASGSGIGETASNLARFIKNQNKSHSALSSLAFTLSRRSMLKYRSFVTASTEEELLDGLQKQIVGDKRALTHVATLRVCFVFTGQGAQWPGMGRQLLVSNPIFAKSMYNSEEILLRLGSEWHLVEELCREENSRINEAALSQPICTAIQIALVDMLKAWNVLPDGVIGHSSGEIAAAYAAGMLSAEDALKAAYHRGTCVQKLKARYPEVRGAMLATGISATEAQKYLLEESVVGHAAVACVNSPSSVTISGDEDAVSKIQEMLAGKNLFSRRLVVEAAYHSHHMELVRGEYATSLQNLRSVRGHPGVRMVSSVDGNEIKDGEVDASYWCKNLTSPVLFSDALSKLLANLQERPGPIAVVEIGPHSALAGPIQQIVKTSKLQGVDYLSMLSRNQDASNTAITLAGQIFERGYSALDFDSINDPFGDAEKFVLADLPTYNWTHRTAHWIESRRSANYRLRKFPRHDLLGAPSVDSISSEPTWRNYLRLQEQPWLVGHAIGGSVVFPAAGYLSMVLEAIKQSTLNKAKRWRDMRIKFRQVNFGSALIIAEDACIEIFLSLRPQPGNESWKEFRIYSTSPNNDATEHCRGVVTALPQNNGRKDLCDDVSNAFVQEVSNSCQMRIDPGKMYRALKAVGLDYSGLFANQKSIIASSSAVFCVVEIPDAQASMPSKHQQPHCIHPSTLDLCLQSIYPAMKASGLLGSSVVISGIDEFEFHTNMPSTPGKQLEVATKFQTYGRSKVREDIVISHTQFSKTAIYMKINGVVFSSSGGPLHSGASKRLQGESLTHRLQWSLDPDLAGSKSIIDRCKLLQNSMQNYSIVCEQYSKILIRRTLDSLSATSKEVSKVEGHFSMLLEWMKRNDHNEQDSSIFTPDEGLEAQVTANGGILGHVLVEVGPHLADVMCGSTNALELLQQEQRLDRLYNIDAFDRCNVQLANYVKLLHFKSPNVRILEIGAGTASATQAVFRALTETKGCAGRSRVDCYTFTDISSGFFPKAEEKLGRFSRFRDVIEFKKLDIEMPPQDQGFEPGTYDLVIASNVLHATRDIENTLKNVRTLLKQDGHLALVELTAPKLAIGLIFGMLPGWWLSTDGREGGPLLSTPSWNAKLISCGFSGVDVDIPNYDDASHDMSVLISSAKRFQMPQSVQIMSETTERHLSGQLSKLFSKAHIATKEVSLSTLEPDGQLVVVLLESVGPFLATCSKSEWAHLRQMFSLASGILWLTTGAAIECADPKRALITGLSRCLRSENHSLKFVTLDLEPKAASESVLEWGQRIAEQAFSLFQGTLGPHATPALADWEYAIRGGEVLIPRLAEDAEVDRYILDCVSNFHPLEEREEDALQEGRALGLNIQIPGLLDTLYWCDVERHSRSVGSNEVRVQLDFVSLNFKDVMIAMGQLDGHTTLLFEGGGKVVAVGDAVSDQYAIGESVYVFDYNGLATVSNVQEFCVHRIPEGISMESAVAAGVAHATAFYCLDKAGALCEGESILIHSGTGAVGQAAITLAQRYFRAGEVYVTVGNQEKRDFIKEKFGISEQNIFSSRTLDFHDAILSRTGGQGVDVVLNSLHGEALQKSVDVLAPFGRFIEIGKKDLLNSSEARLELRCLERNVQFSTVDLTLLCQKRPAQLHGIFSTIFSLLSDEKILGVSPINVSPASQVEESFRTMQAGRHMGKLLIKLNAGSLMLIQPPKPSAVELDPNCSYLVIGGSGGLGRAILRHLADLGAKHLVTLSRSGSDSQWMRELTTEMSARGVEVVVHKGSVLDKQEIEAIKTHSRLHPIRGIVQGAMVLQDSRVDKLTYEQWQAAVEPKVDGTWNLHEVFDDSLDFFILLSSTGGILGSFSQGNYCAGNTFQDAFARFRGGLGLPARSIDVGIIEDEGYTAEDESALEFVRRQGLASYKLQEFLVTIEESIRNPIATSPAQAQLICGLRRADPDSGTQDAALQRRDLKFSHIWRKEVALEQQMTAASSHIDIAAALKACTTPEQALEAVLQAMKAKLARLLAMPVEEMSADRSMANYGVDSLIAVELRNWISMELGARIQNFELTSSIPLTDLAMLIAKRSSMIGGDVFCNNS
ncbi:polyketide synthase [Periconia macrospinosa]|uniref:Polyketide synthase n=1 Tax=Periconia macrospinosa TaxID=97972 RepID=A0A2V1DTF0_9PLEO|nr:polyketide synthase [Periconia macrospinosa]